MKLNSLIIILCLISLSSCIWNCNYHVTVKSIRLTGDCNFDNGIAVAKIRVDSFYNGRPIKYKYYFKARLGTSEWRERNLKEIYFDKENKGFEWHIYYKSNPDSVSFDGSKWNKRIAPFEFKEENWYLISGIEKGGFGGPQLIFVYVDKGLKIKTINYYPPTNF